MQELVCFRIPGVSVILVLPFSWAALTPELTCLCSLCGGRVTARLRLPVNVLALLLNTMKSMRFGL